MRRFVWQILGEKPRSEARHISVQIPLARTIWVTPTLTQEEVNRRGLWSREESDWLSCIWPASVTNMHLCELKMLQMFLRQIWKSGHTIMCQYRAFWMPNVPVTRVEFYTLTFLGCLRVFCLCPSYCSSPSSSSSSHMHTRCYTWKQFFHRKFSTFHKRKYVSFLLCL